MFSPSSSQPSIPQKSKAFPASISGETEHHSRAMLSESDRAETSARTGTHAVVQKGHSVAAVVHVGYSPKLKFSIDRIDSLINRIDSKCI